MTSRYFNAVFVVLVRRLEVVELAINPADAIREARMPEEIAVATRFLECFIQRRECRRHLPLVSLRQAAKEETRQQQEAVAQFGSELQRFIYRRHCQRI